MYENSVSSENSENSVKNIFTAYKQFTQCKKCNHYKQCKEFIAQCKVSSPCSVTRALWGTFFRTLFFPC